MSTPQQPAHNVDFAPLGYHQSDEGKSIDILKFTMSIRNMLIGGLAIGLILGVGVYMYLGPAYQADTRIEVSQKSAIPTDEQSVNFSGERTEHIHLIKSDAIVSRAVRDHGLSELPAFQRAKDPVMDVIDSLTVKRSAGSDQSFVNLIDISYLHPDRETAGRVVDALVAAYRDYLDAKQDENSEDLHASLVRRQAELADAIERLQSEYHAFREAAPYYLPTPPTVTVNGNVVPGKNPYQARVEKIGTDISRNQVMQSEIASRIATLQELQASGESREALEFFVIHWMSKGQSSSGDGESGGGGGSLLTEPPAKAELDKRFLDLQLMRDRLMVQLGEDHPNVIKLHQQLATLTDFYRQKGHTPPRSSRPGALPGNGGEEDRGPIDLVAAYIRIQQQELMHREDLGGRLAGDLEIAEAEAKAAGLFEVEDQKRKDEIARQKQHWQEVVVELESFGVRKEQEGYRVNQIAQVRVEKSIKRIIKIVGAMGCLGIAVVFGLSYLREWSDMRLRTTDELRGLVPDSVIGEIPEYSPSTAAARSPSGLDGRLCYYHRPGSREAEAFRSIRMAVLRNQPESGGLVVQMTSAEPGDGKSVSAANLSLAIAKSGKRVLLIDADMRRPTVHQLFRVEQEIGLSDVLTGEIDWINAVRETSVDGLSLITSGACPDNPAELLTAHEMASLLNKAREEYDVVIVDTPPVLAVSDPSVIAPQADGLVLVVRMQKNKRAAIRRTLETLDGHGVRVLGVIANGVSAAADEYRANQYSSYYNPDLQPARATRPPHRVSLDA